MSILSSVTSILEPTRYLGIPSEECKPTKSDDRGDDKKGREESKNDDHEKQAKNDDCRPQKDDCDHKPSDDCGKGDHPGDALAKFDFSHSNLGSQGPDHTGDVHAALASMSPDHALDYAIGQMGPADHVDVAHFDAPADTSHDMGHHA